MRFILKWHIALTPTHSCLHSDDLLQEEARLKWCTQTTSPTLQAGAWATQVNWRLEPRHDFGRNAAFLKKTLDKRRNRTSSSDESSTSPEAKKPRSGNTDLSEQTEENNHDKILAALSMAEGLQETLKEINQKLKKLRNILSLQRALNTSRKKPNRPLQIYRRRMKLFKPSLPSWRIKICI